MKYLGFKIIPCGFSSSLLSWPKFCPRKLTEFFNLILTERKVSMSHFDSTLTSMREVHE